MEWFEQQESRLTLFLHSSGVVSEGGLEPPWSFAPQGPQPCASTKFRHSDICGKRTETAACAAVQARFSPDGWEFAAGAAFSRFLLGTRLRHGVYSLWRCLSIIRRA